MWRAFAAEAPHALQPAGWCAGPQLCAALLDHPGIRVHWNSPVEMPTVERQDDVARFWCTARAGPGRVALRAIRGQQSLWPAGRGQLGEFPLRCGDVVAVDTAEGLYFGASRVFDETRADLRPSEALAYAAALPRPPGAGDLASMQHWAGIRYQSRDRLPLVGPAPAHWEEGDIGVPSGRARVEDLPAARCDWLNLGHAARGATSAPLAATLLADLWLGLPAAVLRAERDALDARRFALRDWKRGHPGGDQNPEQI